MKKTVSIYFFLQAATLSNTLNLQHLAGKILNLIAKNVCQISGPKITASQALSMNVVLTGNDQFVAYLLRNLLILHFLGGLELGSYSADCWLPIFSVCQHVTQLEHDLFSSSQKSANITNATSAPTSNKDNESPKKDKLNLSAFAVDDDETCVDVYSFLEAPLQSLNTNITAILSTYPVGNEDVVLTQGDTAKVLCVLAHQADNLFTDASERLNLPSLCQFLKYLCRASREQLYRDPNSKKGKKLWWPLATTVAWKQNKKNNTVPLSLLLHRIGDATLKVFRGSRPLLHILKVWAITGPHLMDVSFWQEGNV
jgi:brefeldin A-inhibited guanine nucleotide-exchange protein 3